MALILRRPKAVSKDQGQFICADGGHGGLVLRDAILQIAPQDEGES
jgi:hypothetical protein